ncbi:MAG: hypothetical protein COW52_11320 [Nitrospirae bacterium CG17_big_fil_post_rev_8_21_14_2_50_50_9]|nr:MAG: hypothetical protein COW52_11320 [Nitrospirae bacterium CG17_big_fil_post_rev_8_21_14_2_50_50_9]
MLDRRYLILASVVFILFPGCSHLHPEVMTLSDFTWSVETGPVNAGQYRAVTAADLNQDGFPDLIAGSFNPGGVTIWTGDGKGKWRLARKPPVNGDVRSIAVCDINGDGNQDLAVVGQRDLKGVMVLLQGADGSWKQGNSPVETGSYESVKCLDVNKDGNPDIVAANSSGDQEGGIQVWFGDGKGEWIQQAGPDAAHIYRDAALTDINGDGNLDIIATSWGRPGGIHIYLGSGDGAWSTFPSPAKEGDFWGVAVADLNHDGWMDIAATTYYQGIKIWTGNGKGDWQDVTFPVNRGFYWSILVSDFNKDGRMDIAASSVDSGGVRVWFGGKVGGWLSMGKGLPESGSFYGLTASDLDGDGVHDLIAASYSEGVQIWFGGHGEKRAVKEIQAVPSGREAKEASNPFLTRFAVPFEPNGEDLSKAAQVVIAEIVKTLRSSSYETIRIEGHADRLEKPEGQGSLMALSEARAEKVKKILDESLQIEPGRISVTGFADSRPAEESVSGAGSGNSVVEIIISHQAGVDGHPAPSEAEKKQQDEFIKSQFLTEYKVGPGDILKVVFWKQFSADEYEVLIRPDGTLSLFMVDDLSAGGLTLTELDRLLTEKLSRYFKNPRIDITIKEFHSQEVMILGAVNSLVRQPTGPGVYVLKKPTKIVELLTIAGGPLPTANLKKVTVTRKNGTTLSVNLYKAIFQANASEDIPIYPGDSIFIPETSEGMSKVYVFGEVKNPGIYDLKEGMSVLDAVGRAGSFTEDAVVQSTHLIRGDLSRPEVIPVDVKRFFQKGDLSANLVLQNNDIIYVPKNRIASVSYLLTKIKPMLDFVLFPYQFESMRTTIDLNKENVRPLTTP